MITALLFSTLAMAQVRTEIIETIRTEAVEIGVNPDLAVAIAAVESSLNPYAVGQLGEIGLFQLRPEFHDVRVGQTAHNVRVALTYLKYIREKWEPQVGDAWFVMYNCGPYNPPKLYRQAPKQTPYYQKVMREVRKIAAN